MKAERMKKTLIHFLVLIFFCLSVSFNASAQAVNTDDLPDKVTIAFDALYPKSKQVKWLLNKKKHYEAKFERDNKKHLAEFTEDGIWLRTNVQISQEKMPQKLNEYIKANYKKTYTLDAVGVEDRIDGKYYQMIITTPERTDKLLFDLQGNFLKKEE
jgi:hypothetical protein